MLSEFAERNLFVKLEQNIQLFLVGLGSSCTHTYSFSKKCPLKAVKKIIPFRIFEIIWVHSPNRQNESVDLM